MTQRRETPTPDALRYIERVESTVEGRDPLTILATTPRELARIVDDRPADDLLLPEVPGTWSALQVLVHLADCEMVYGHRLRLTLTLDEPQFLAFDQERWCSELGYQSADGKNSLQRLHAGRTEHLRLLRDLKGEQWARVGFHPRRGRESVAQLAVRWAGHDLLHLAQLTRIFRALDR